MKEIRLKIKLSFFLTLAIFLSGCASFTGVGTDNTPAPTKLGKISSEFHPKIVQSFSLKDKIYAHAQADDNLYTATHKGVVSQYNLNTGKLIWQKDIDTPLVSSMGASSNTVLLGSESGQIYALNSSNGKSLWKISIKSLLGATPVFTQDKIILKTLDGQLLAVNAKSGQMLWQVNHGSPLMVLSQGSTPKILGDKVIVGFSDGKLSAYSLANGNLIWETQIAQPTGATDVEQMIDIASSLQIDNGVVYTAAYQGNLAAVDANSGRVLWQTPVSAYKGLTLFNDAIYLTDAQSALLKINPHNGQIIFTQNALKYRGLTTPVIDNQLLICGDKEGYVHYLDLASGKIVSRIDINDGAIISLTPRDNLLYVLTKNGVVKKMRI